MRTVIRYKTGDMVRRSSPFDSCDYYYIVLDVMVDSAGWVWYTCFSLGSGSVYEFLLDDDHSKKYELVG